MRPSAKDTELKIETSIRPLGSSPLKMLYFHLKDEYLQK